MLQDQQDAQRGEYLTPELPESQGLQNLGNIIFSSISLAYGEFVHTGVEVPNPNPPMVGAIPQQLALHTSGRKHAGPDTV